MSEYGPFAPIVLLAGILVTAFSVITLKAVGRVSRWTWLIDASPPFIVTTALRAATIGLMVLAFVMLDTTNYRLFVGLAALSGLLALLLIGWFDLLRRQHTCVVPLIGENGQQALNRRGRPMSKSVVIGTVANMRPEAKAVFDENPGLSPCRFLSGYGVNEVNNPAAIWDQGLLARIAYKMTMILMVGLLAAIMALYLAAASLDRHLQTQASVTSADSMEFGSALCSTSPPNAPASSPRPCGG